MITGYRSQAVAAITAILVLGSIIFKIHLTPEAKESIITLAAIAYAYFMAAKVQRGK